MAIGLCQHLPGCIIVLSIGLKAISAHAVPIDDFSTAQPAAVDVTNDAAFAVSVQAGPIAGTIVPAGGKREIRVSKTNNAIGSIEAEVLPGALLYDAVGTVGGQFSINYVDFGGLDLSGYETLTVAGTIDTSAASAAGTTLGILLEDGSAASAASSFTLNTEGMFWQGIPLSDFAVVNLSDVTRIALGTFDDLGNFVNVPPGGDITLLRFEATQQVPEPAAFCLWLIFGVLLGVARGGSAIGRRAQSRQKLGKWK